MTATNASGVLERTDEARRHISKMLSKKQKLEQYFSSVPLAHMMASMMDYRQKDIRILDPGAGVGSLFAACVEEICGRKALPDKVDVTAYEIDRRLAGSLEDSLEISGRLCDALGVRFSGKRVERDFIEDCAGAPDGPRFTHIIMNPPYQKISVSSRTHDILRDAGMWTTNMYAAFIAVAHNLLADGGQMTFISPRSFCNGPYFSSFRKGFLESMAPRRIHLFRSRSSSFRDDGVLQENVIIHAEKNGRRGDVVVSSSRGPGDEVDQRRVRGSTVVFGDDPQRFIHIVHDEQGMQDSRKIRGLGHTLEDLGLGVSTGKVVDYRIAGELRQGDVRGAVPLVRPFNVSGGTTRFPILGKKHSNFIMAGAKSRKLLVENGNYVLVKRFTTIEEKKRIVASIWTKKAHDSDLVGFENRINYFHRGGAGLQAGVARGLWVFLNSTAVDTYFRQFNGNTQVNATDLRYLRYPSALQLVDLGRAAGPRLVQEDVDRATERMFGGAARES